MAATRAPRTLVDRVVVLDASGANIATDASKGDIFDVALPANRTMSAPTHLSDGQTIFYRLQQTGAGGWTVTWNAIFDWGAGGAPTLTVTTGKTDLCGGKYCARTGKVMMLPAALGYAA